MSNEDKFTKSIDDTELDEVAGGLKDGTVWYYEPSYKKELDVKASIQAKKPVEGYRFGYLVSGENHKTGNKIATRFIAAESFDDFRSLNYGDDFVEGSIEISKVQKAVSQKSPSPIDDLP